MLENNISVTNQYLFQAIILQRFNLFFDETTLNSIEIL